MLEMRSVYQIRIPLDGQPDGFYTICRALTAAGAGSTAAALLDTNDPRITEVRIVRDQEAFLPGDK